MKTYNREYFVKQGRKGGKIGGKRNVKTAKRDGNGRFIRRKEGSKVMHKEGLAP